MSRYRIITCTFLLCIIFNGFWLMAQNPAEDEIARRLHQADSLHNIGRTDTAAIIGEETIRLADRLGNDALKVGANASQGVFLRSLGNIEAALERYNTALDIVTSDKFRAHPDQESIEQTATLYINLATLNLDMHHKEEAVKNAEFAGQWLVKSDDADLKGIGFGAVGSVLIAAEEYEKAFDFERKAYDNAQISKDMDGAFRAAVYMLLLADRTGNVDVADEWRKKCSEILPDINGLMTRLLYYQVECSIAMKHNHPKEALKWFKEILSLDGIENLPFVKFDCLNNMHETYADLGDYRSAYTTLVQSNEIRDSIWETQKAESLRELTVKYETKEKELALARSESRKSQLLMWLFASLTILVSVIGWFLYYSSRQKRNRLRREKEFADLRNETERRLTREYLEGLESERARMAKELHDGVSNDLFAIKLAIQQRGLDSEAEVMIDNCREAVRRVSHELMPPEFSYATLEEVIRYFVSQQNKAAGDRINLIYNSEVSYKDLEGITDESALEIYRIVQEATGNAIKYSGGSIVSITLKIEGESLEVVIEDNGKFRQNEKKGIGLESIKRRALSLKGTLSIENRDGEDENRGTVIRLIVPLSGIRR